MTTPDTAVRTPAPEGEVLLWGCADGNGIDPRLVFRDRPTAEQVAADMNMVVRPLYASPVVPAPEGEALTEEDRQRIDQLPFALAMKVYRSMSKASAPVVPVGGGEAVENLRRQRDHPTSETLGFTTIRTCDADAILAALRLTDTGANHD